MTQLRRGLVPGVFVLLAVPGFNASADSHASPPVQPALEAFFCNYNPGKDRDDLDSATNFYMKQAKKAGFTTPNAFLWTHNKGTAPADIVWMNVHESLVAYGASDDAAAASSEMAGVHDPRSPRTRVLSAMGSDLTPWWIFATISGRRTKEWVMRAWPRRSRSSR
jgi:hypothetical protein